MAMPRNCLLQSVLSFTANQRTKKTLFSDLVIEFHSVVHLGGFIGSRIFQFYSAKQKKAQTLDFHCQAVSPLEKNKDGKKNKTEKILELGVQITVLGPSLGLVMSY